MRTNRVLLAAAASVMAFALTGCGGDDGAAKVPTADGGGSSASAGATGGKDGAGGKDEIAAYVDGQRAYVTCMRKNGVDLPDPDARGRIDYGTGGNALTLKKNPKFVAASQKCASLAPAVPESLEKADNPKLTPEQLKTRRDYAACMQKNGAPDFPDPGPDGDWGGSSGSEWNQTSAGARRATRLCAAINGDPTDPPPAKG
ncbi:hypothetical protein EAO71_16275 [Streptomyces sp. ms191]|uniref:hypothetical protein n=1 Tax=unclassified Streptomyces TaxID=2593676 RepID=UPI0011CECCFF|nr:hypothetical protein [Streptomyces sp. ms191]TXS30098.1 hypothetical protein EAO71_16275 [Streptomyces sp. ms191]